MSWENKVPVWPEEMLWMKNQFMWQLNPKRKKKSLTSWGGGGGGGGILSFYKSKKKREKVGVWPTPDI